MEKIERDTLISAEENRKMFDKIANTYDIANRFISLGLDQGWRKKTINELNPKENKFYLDIGTGTGDLAFELLSQSPNSQVDAIDPSEKMLAVARDKSLNLGVSKRPRFQNADALNLPMPDNFFDGIVSGFCFRNIENRLKALEEMFRVLKKNGTALIVIHGKGEGVLKEEIRQLLNKYPVEAKDADYRIYGLGATEVRFF